MSNYGTVLDPFPAGCAPTDRACLHREHYAQKPPFLLPGDCPPNAKCKQEVGGRREPLVTTAGITDQWWFFPAVAVGAWWLFSGRK